MHKGSKKGNFTEKSSLVKSFKAYKNKGFKVCEIAEKLNISLSTAKKISSKLKRKNSQKEKILEQFKTNPYIELNQLDLTDLQKDILYKSKEWLTEIKPLRVISELRNNPKNDHEKVIKNLSIDTLSALEEEFTSEWFETLTIRKEFKDFKSMLPQIKKELDNVKLTTHMYVHYSPGRIVSISDLKEIKSLIPNEERFPLPKSATKRLMISEQVAIMHDAKYLQISNDVNILENMITRLRERILQKYICNLCDGTKRLINIYFKNPILSTDLNLTKDETDIWVGIDKFFDSQDEKMSQSAQDNNDIEINEQSFAFEEVMALENQAFVSGCGKRLGKMGSDKTGQKMAYAMNLLK
ncbi:hypothetical protein [Ruminiclostridium cellobioparum]|uniref:hypothetical protein n=1 Tax=Ruminiclostridium cellobioparum TaxID=29355 RepID=UPI0028A94682|nr:hypothetical protein [Ruminiclostridium cellobioparum]